MRHGDKPPEYRILARYAHERKTPSTIDHIDVLPRSDFSSLYSNILLTPRLSGECKKCKIYCNVSAYIQFLSRKSYFSWNGDGKLGGETAAGEPRWEFRRVKCHTRIFTSRMTQTPGVWAIDMYWELHIVNRSLENSWNTHNFLFLEWTGAVITFVRFFKH